jgi:hypothetical protein
MTYLFKSVCETYLAYLYMHCVQQHSGVTVSCATVFSFFYQCGMVLALDLSCFPAIAHLQSSTHLGLITTSFFGFGAAISSIDIEETSLLSVEYRSLYCFLLLPKVHCTHSWCNLFLLTGKQDFNYSKTPI